MSNAIHTKQLLLSVAIISTVISNAQKSVLTQHNDVNRTGWYDNEVVLNKSNVMTSSFGKIFSRSVDGEIYAQPLVKLNLLLPGVGIKNVVFVATVNNSIYAFDADAANVTSPYWQVNLTPPGSRVIKNTDETGACSGNYVDFSGNMGIVGTPAIDSTTGVMYVVARSVNTGANTFQQYLHALDITTGAEKPNSPLLISATASGSGDGSNGGVLPFDPLRQNQRSGLLLLNGVVYIAWGSQCDLSPYHGWLMGFDATTLQRKYVYCSTAEGWGGGIWMAGGGPSADENGNVYVGVANGSTGQNGDPTNPVNRSSSALKLLPSGSSFAIQSYFTPANYQTLDGADLDFGVTQVMLIPNTNRAMVGAKDGHLFVLDRDNMGGYNGTTNQVLQTIDLGSNAFLRSSMSYFRGSKEYVYSWSENSLLRAYPYNRSTNLFDLGNTVASGLQGPTGNSGAVLSVSSNGSDDATGILWASYAANGDANHSVRPGVLRAIDATDVTRELWNSLSDPADDVGNYAKFSCPTIANGKVYLATFSNQLVVYGLKGGQGNSCNSPNVALNKPAFASSIENSNFPASNVTDGNLSTRWSSQFSDPQYVYVDLGQRYDICGVVLHWETALGKDFKIQVSDDASAWTDIATITNNAASLNNISVVGSGRYVRMYGTKRGTSFGYSLFEFEVNGQQAAVSCATPTNLSVSDVSETGAILHWSVSGATTTVVQYKTVTAVDWTQFTTPANSFALTDIACNTPYQFRVRAVCNGTDSSAFSAAVGFTTLQCNINCDPLPTRWSTQDIGSTAMAGSACYDGPTGTFALQGSGGDIGGTADAFRYAYMTITPGGEISAHVVDQDNVNASDKCGIMVRETLAEGSRFAFLGLTSGNGVIFETRSTTDAQSNTVTTVAGIRAPYWLKLEIVGSLYTASISPDGLAWTKISNAADAGFGSNGLPAYGGFAITSHDNTRLSSAHIDNFGSGPILPLTLLSFTGRLSLSHTVALDWITTRELGTNYFIVERTRDNWNYFPIDTVYAENSGEYTVDYSAMDYHPLDGMNYYRLRIVDMDGKISYSPIVAVRVSNTKSPLMFPNPSNTYVNIARGTEAINYINIYNILGRTILKIPDATSRTTIQIPTYPIANGVYFVEIRTANIRYVERLVIHH